MTHALLTSHLLASPEATAAWLRALDSGSYGDWKTKVNSLTRGRTDIATNQVGASVPTLLELDVGDESVIRDHTLVAINRILDREDRPLKARLLECGVLMSSVQMWEHAYDEGNGRLSRVAAYVVSGFPRSEQQLRRDIAIMVEKRDPETGKHVDVAPIKVSLPTTMMKELKGSVYTEYMQEFLPHYAIESRFRWHKGKSNSVAISVWSLDEISDQRMTKLTRDRQFGRAAICMELHVRGMLTPDIYRQIQTYDSTPYTWLLGPDGLKAAHERMQEMSTRTLVRFMDEFTNPTMEVSTAQSVKPPTNVRDLVLTETARKSYLMNPILEPGLPRTGRIL